MQDAQVNLVGYLAADPQWKKVAGDISTAKLRVASTARWRNRETGEWVEGATSFVNVQCWRQLADNVSTCLRKGEPVMVSGRLHIRRYEDRDGHPRSVTEIEASAVGYDLCRGVAQFRRLRPPVAAASDGMRPIAEADRGGEPRADTGGEPGGVVDEEAVAQFARELSVIPGPREPLPGDLPPDPLTGERKAADPGTGDPDTGGPEADGGQAADSGKPGRQRAVAGRA